MPFLLIIRNDRIARRIVARIRSVALSPTAAGLYLLHDRLALQKSDVLIHRRRAKRAKRGNIVDDPNSTPVRSDYKIVIARMYRHVANGDIREFTALVLCPLSSTVDRNPQA